MNAQRGDPVVVRTPDRREYRGHLVEWREGAAGQQQVVVRLDTGWVTTYPMQMVHLDESGRGRLDPERR